jgi:hypothetical protein
VKRLLEERVLRRHAASADAEHPGHAGAGRVRAARSATRSRSAGPRKRRARMESGRAGRSTPPTAPPLAGLSA